MIRTSSAIATKHQTTLHCSLSPGMQYFTVNLTLKSLFLPIAEVMCGFFFSSSSCSEGWLFSPRALSFVSQPSYSAEDTGSTGLGSYCSKGKSLSMEFLPIIKFLVDQGPDSLVPVVCFLLFNEGE